MKIKVGEERDYGLTRTELDDRLGVERAKEYLDWTYRNGNTCELLVRENGDMEGLHFLVDVERWLGRYKGTEVIWSR